MSVSDLKFWFGAAVVFLPLAISIIVKIVLGRRALNRRLDDMAKKNDPTRRK
jgi:hypothetical protein